ncbi:hypothetical protein ACFWYW_04790 [Nonomuraea sp. NPDC059023]|uniref:hypothetical protein n=1 Tax=unclassified Nonomuraea TaxID=2593643 RepID=UPI003699328B
MSGEQRRFELSVPQVLGGALAAVTAAVAASYLGVAGTVIGAAVASVASTVGSAIYTHYLKRTGEKVKEHTVLAWREHEDGEEVPPHRDGEGELATAAQATLRDEPPPEPGAGEATLVMAAVEKPERRRPLPWLKLGFAAALVFAISMGAILVYQAASGSAIPDQLPGKRPASVREEPKGPVKEDEHTTPPTETPATQDEPEPTPTPTPTPTPKPSKTRTPTPTPTPTKTGEAEPSGEPTTDPPEETGQPEEEATPPPDEAPADQERAPIP